MIFLDKIAENVSAIIPQIGRFMVNKSGNILRSAPEVKKIVAQPLQKWDRGRNVSTYSAARESVLKSNKPVAIFKKGT